MRLFVALDVPAGALRELDEAVSPHRPAWPDLRWSGPDAWHLTLAFLGEVEEPVVGPLAGRLERAAHRHQTLDLALRGAGAFPGAGRARVLWAGVRGDSRALGALAATVGAAARRAGAPPASQGRRYQAHLTLARCRRPADLRELVDALEGFSGSPWTAAAIRLVRSRPGGTPRYEDLGAWPLRSQPVKADK